MGRDDRKDGTAAEGTEGRNAGNRVLIVDARVDEAQFLLEAVEGASGGVEAEVTFTAERALDLLDDRSFDCVLPAFDLPETNGVDLVRRLREEGHDLPVVVRTDRDPELLEDSVREAGAAALVEEADDEQRIRRTVEDVLASEAAPTVP